MGQVKVKSTSIKLSSIKELEGVLTDGKLFISEIEKQGTILAQKLGEAENQKRILDKAVVNLKSLAFNSGKNLVSEFKTKAKDLGIDVSSISQLKEIEKLVETTKEYEKYFNGLPKIPQI